MTNIAKKENEVFIDHEQRITRLETNNINVTQILLRIDSRLERMESKIDSNFKWMIMFFIGGYSTLVGFIMRGFHWI